MKLIYLSGKYVNIDTIRTIAEVSAGQHYSLTFIDGDTMHINQGEYEMLVENFAIKMKAVSYGEKSEQASQRATDKITQALQKMVSKEKKPYELWANIFFNFKTITHQGGYELGKFYHTKEDAEQEEFAKEDGSWLGVAHITW